ncbi:uncharacterized protein VTP21DRAFT_5370 [Calcarisporiella thermophila]|uniref:uncharacterized protein n=1 Tax=Calcarisporiella thermophila TaxID=911321 RepID=UPI0037439AC0
MPNEYILHYHDVILRREDVKLLDTNDWINDTIIEFYYEWLERTVLGENSHILLLRPGMVHLISHAKDTTDFVSALPPAISRSTVLFIPINDNNDGHRAGGSHWSLLVFYRPTRVFYHYDSMNDYNEHHAQRTANRFCQLLGVRGGPLIRKYAYSTFDLVWDAKFKNMRTPQQNNGSDCGVFVISFTDVLVQRLLTSQPRDEMWELKPGDVLRASQQRRRLRSLIDELVSTAGGVGRTIG